MKETGIVFGAASVLAILAGKKTQTRRVLYPKPDGDHGIAPMWGKSPDGVAFGDPYLWCEVGPDYPDGDTDLRRCPYGVPGDLLVVRETWAPWPGHFGPSIAYKAGPPFSDRFKAASNGRTIDDQKQAVWLERWERKHGGYTNFNDDVKAPARWASPTQMPLWASRIRLELTDVRVEQLQEISDKDARAEGRGAVWGEGCFHRSFAGLWDEINGRRAPWRSNPWIWALTFKVIEIKGQDKE